MGWFALATGSVLASTVAPTNAPWRAPDGIATAVVPADGRPWTISERGEVTGFERDGTVRTRFQACPDRGVHMALEVDRAGTVAGVDCGSTYRVLSLPGGELRFEVAAFTTDAAFSQDGAQLALLGERIVDGVSEDTSQLLRFDARTGRAFDSEPSDWEAIEATRNGWVGATTHERDTGPLDVAGRIQVGSSILRWNWRAPEAQRTTADWGARQALAVFDRGRWVCVVYDFGGTCLDGHTGAPRDFFTVPEAERTPASRARPHPHGFALGDRVAFLRTDGVWLWGIDSEPARMPGATDVPVADADGTTRFRVERARLVPVGPDGKASVQDWGLPVSADLATGGRLVVADARRRVFVREPDGAVRRVPGEAERVRIAPDGSEAWLFPAKGPVRVVSLDGSAPEKRFDTPAVAFDGQRAWGIATEGDSRRLVDLRNPETGIPIADALDVTGLQARAGQVLVEYGQEDTWELVKPPGTRSGLSGHSFVPQTDLLLTPEGVVGVAEIDDGWQIGRHTTGFDTWVRFLDDGRFVTAADDGTVLELHGHPSGELITTRELPGRWSGLWTAGSTVIVALRDGRVVLESF